MAITQRDDTADREAIAIIGMAGRFPGADSIAALWTLLCDGREGLTRFDRQALIDAGVPEAVADSPDYVPVNGRLAGIEMFDAEFFRMPPREARITDPQHRVLLELAWQALEDSGHDPDRYDGAVGVYAGCGASSYLLNNLWPNRAALAEVGGVPIQIGTNKDYLASRISYKLGLTGPSVCVTTSCSTSLVAVHMAVQALLDGQCDMALAGGAGIQVPQDTGYLHQPGGILSPDGHCRAFDASAGGTVGGSGAALVVLKRLADALADGDTVQAVILGSAINNDGADKAGYTAPSVVGQAAVIAEAQAVAAVDPASIGYVEAHGTGTPLGDPIEVAALARVFAGRPAPCLLGSIKTNIGHLDEAAGIAGLIKTVLCLKHRRIPPSLHFTRPNPEIDLAAAGFAVPRSLTDWPAPDGHPRRAGVSSFGIGGTNAHVVLEEAPEPTLAPARRPAQLLPLSARTDTALTRRARDLADRLAVRDAPPLADAAVTLQLGRRQFTRRGFVVAADNDDACASLKRLSAGRDTPADPPPVVFLCSGQGSQYPGMGRDLYDHEPAFRDALDTCADGLAPLLGLDLRQILYPNDAAGAREAAVRLRGTELAQPALFAVEYAVASLWRAWGVTPAALIGHSLGEYVAACLAGVMDLDTALALVAARGRLMQAAPPGAMLAIPLPADEVAGLLGDGVELAAINAPDRCVVSGRTTAIEALAADLHGRGCSAQRLAVSHAFHSALMAPALPPFAEELARHTLHSPTLPYLSNLTGDWISAEAACDPASYLRHLREPVAFAAGIERLMRDHPDAVLLEIGPGQALATAARRTAGPQTRALASLPSAERRSADHRTLLTAFGSLWQSGVSVDWTAFAEPGRRRASLPGYPFERTRHWIDAPRPVSAPTAPAPQKDADLRRWFYAPTWHRSQPVDDPVDAAAGPWLVFGTAGNLGTELADRLRARGATVTIAQAGDRFARLTEDRFTVRPDVGQDAIALLDALARAERMPARIVYLSTPDPDSDGRDAVDALLTFARALAARADPGAVDLVLVLTGAEDVTGDEPLDPACAAALGAAAVIGQELPAVTCRTIDIAPGTDTDAVLRELIKATPESRVALRGRYRWVFGVAPLPVRAPSDGLPPLLRREGVYLITGGLGRLGLLLADYLAQRAAARLVLVGRSGLTDAQAHRIATMRRAGAEVLPIKADIRDPEQMAGVRRQAEAAFGRVDGVIHAAALPAADSYREIRNLSLEHSAQEFAVKPGGLAVLERVFDDCPPDFYLLFSSLAAILGGLGFARYAAANAQLDAVARQRNRGGGTIWIAVNWDGWDLGPEATGRSALEERLRDLSIRAEDGPRLFDILFDARYAPQVAISTWDLSARLARWRDRTSGPVAPEAVSEASPATGTTGTDASIAEVWCDVLGLERVGPHDDFFALNGDSLLATQLVARINRRLGAGLSVRDLFENPTVAGLATLLDGPRDTACAPESAPESAPASALAADHISPAAPADDDPLSHGQRRIWLLSQSPEASVAYNMSYSMRLLGPLDADALGEAFRYVVARHDSLRTAFVVRAGEPRQVVRARAPFALSVRDLRATADPEGTALRAARDEALAPFDLTASPLLRARLLRLGSADHVLLVTLHHIVADGLSLNILIRELDHAYRAHSEGRTPDLPALTLQYRDFAVWQTCALQGPAMLSHLDYWRDRLRGDLPRLALPGQRGDAAASHAGGQVFVTLSPRHRDRLHGFCRDEKVTLFMLLTATLKVLLHRASGEEDIVIGTPVAGREQAELDNQIGHYLNSVVLRDRIVRRENFRTLLHRVAATVTEAFEHQACPFDLLVADLGVPIRPGETPLFNVMLNLMPTRDLDLRLGDLEIRPFSRENTTTLFDLNVMASDAPSGLALEFAYNRARYEAAAMQRLAGDFLRLLERVAEDPSVTVRDLCGPIADGDSPSGSDKARFLAGALDLDEVF